MNVSTISLLVLMVCPMNFTNQHGASLARILQVKLNRFRLIESDRHGATRLAPKVDGGPLVTELRPITFLNCDYKILTKCFVLRLTPLMPEVIHSGQLCSNGDKNILFGVSNMISSVEYMNLHKVASFIATFDMYKAYDRVMLRYLAQVMVAMNFPCKFIDWILMLSYQGCLLHQTGRSSVNVTLHHLH